MSKRSGVFIGRSNDNAVKHAEGHMWERSHCTTRKNVTTRRNSLSDFHCFFVVMSEEVKGLVRLHCFSPIHPKVKYCKGTNTEGERDSDQFSCIPFM